MAHHTLFVPDLDPETPRLVLTGDEARHAMRVKRLRVGETALALNGAGIEATCEVVAVGRDLELRIVSSRAAEPVAPAVHVFAPIPKGPRSSDLVDALSQAGAATWTPLKSAYATEHATADKLRRLERVAAESAKQCRRAWTLRITERVAAFADALRAPGDEPVILADDSGEPFRTDRNGAPRALRLLVGPEGGWAADELDQARRAGARIANFGPHVMRIEVAAPVAAAILLHEARAGAPAR